jgi:hypothetical protein
VNVPVRPAGRRALLLAAAALTAALLLSACGGVLGSMIGTSSALRQAGYGSVGINVSNDDVTVSVTAGHPPTDADVSEVGAIVWRNLHESFAALLITVHGRGGPTLTSAPTFAELQAHFGARNPAWNTTDVRSATTDLGLAVIVGIVVVIVVAAVVVVVILVVRRRRRGGGPPSASAPPWATAPSVPAPPWGGPQDPWARGPLRPQEPPPGAGGWGPPPEAR